MSPQKDNAEHDQAEAEVSRFEKELGPFVVAAEQTRMPMIFTDANDSNNPVIFANDAFLALVGYQRDEVLGRSFNFFLADTTDAKVTKLIENEFAGNYSDSSEIRCRRKDGERFWANFFISPVKNDQGAIVQYFASFVDLTQHKNSQARSRLLIAELNHRVKNILAIVQAIVRKVLRPPETDLKVMRKSIEDQIFSLSNSNDMLARWEKAGLSNLITDALEPFGFSSSSRIVMKGANVRLSEKAALALTVTFNELATNAVKYGALKTEAGLILIEWSVEGDRLLFRWTEKDGPLVSPPSNVGFGTVVRRALAQELEGDAKIDYRSEGLVFTLDIPMSVQ